MSQYEFSKEQNAEFTIFTKKSATLSLGLILAGLLFLIQSFIPTFIGSNLFNAILHISIGVALFLPIKNFKEVVNTEGSDITTLLTGFDKLNRGLNFVIIIILLFFITLAILLAISEM